MRDRIGLVIAFLVLLIPLWVIIIGMLVHGLLYGFDDGANERLCEDRIVHELIAEGRTWEDANDIYEHVLNAPCAYGGWADESVT